MGVIRDKAADISSKIITLEGELHHLLIDQEVTITSDFNGQPHGTSKPSLRGTTFVVKDVTIDRGHITLWDGNYDHCFIGIGGVKFKHERGS